MKQLSRFLGLTLVACLGAIVLSQTFSLPSLAHMSDLTLAEVQVQDNQAQVRLTFPTVLVSHADDNQNGKLSDLEIANHQEELQTYFSDRFQLTNAGGNPALVTVTPSPEDLLPDTPENAAQTHSTVAVEYQWSQPVTRLNIRYGLYDGEMPFAHCLTTLQYNEQVKTILLSTDQPEQSITLSATPTDNLISKGWLLALPIAFLWGGAHALSPGHGKTMIGAYLVGAKATNRHAVLLGLTTTVTHTLGVFALGLVALFASQYILPEQLYPYLSLLSGGFILAIALNLLRQRLTQPSHQHHPHPHHSHKDHHHHHHHHHPTPTHWSDIFALGVSGGLVPCPAALVLLLTTVAVGHTALGLALVSVFSLGLALTLTTLGLLLVNMKRVFQHFPTPPRLVKLLPVASAGVIAVIGLGVTVQAILELI
ncbi:sulfite exporter TauE/SafE family protein [Spirulina sp. CS-785/01]|uniref:nickel/cobalt transporter n=1 Tax=Spirulina sp. CS-785/01 TaxID=3021716 RepID=UPI00232ED5F0|nr:sulfite exporter TauE/SafE family protein [Spirulina sp. CS-785/01]MDB9312176.1 sulfite exporter TauE/SafE family protein [Spirulina sp. CS-785/01]